VGDKTCHGVASEKKSKFPQGLRPTRAKTQIFISPAT
jgi:hypothetical protein